MFLHPLNRHSGCTKRDMLTVETNYSKLLQMTGIDVNLKNLIYLYMNFVKVLRACSFIPLSLYTAVIPGAIDSILAVERKG